MGSILVELEVECEYIVSVVYFFFKRKCVFNICYFKLWKDGLYYRIVEYGLSMKGEEGEKWIVI